MNSIKRNTSYVLSGILLLTTVCIGLAATSCKKSQNKVVTPVCDGTNATYTNTVKSIVNSSCVSCHSNYSSYSGLSSITGNGLFEKHVLNKQDMPQGSSLTPDQLNKIQCWVNNGYPE